MIDTPDAPPGDVEAGADSGHDENRSVEPQEPVAASVGEDAEEEGEVGEDADEEAQVDEDAEGEAEDPAVRELRAQVAELTQSLAAAQRRADELATVARKQTEMADELHADNRRLRDGENREAVAPLVRGLARLADDLSRMRATA
ncbi:MAG TPA: hypothetical protein VF526_01585, partial [Solirubrobacteraceae bacterium]